MKVSEAINRADSLRDNILTDEQKASWLFDLDGSVSEITGNAVPVNTWPQTDSELLMPAPHDGIYVLYLVAMIDYYNQESNLYMNDMQIFNAAMNEARAWWRRTHKPQTNEYWKVM
ncbi:MAG: hypothetical protein VB078_06900 [Clostridiaceae bacterium]|nr:hypothetical protein [Clostridiaceae bacterium]